VTGVAARPGGGRVVAGAAVVVCGVVVRPAQRRFPAGGGPVSAMAVAVAVAACSTGETRRDPAGSAAAAGAAAAAAGCPADPDADHELVVEIDGRRGCDRFAIVLGHGLLDDGGVDVGTDLVFDRGPGRTPRRYLDTYPAERPFAITVNGEIAVGPASYLLFAGIGGLRRDQWVTPITAQVIPHARAYANTGAPTRAGAYVQISMRVGEAGPRHLDPLRGTVTFTEHDFDRGVYRGSLDLVFAGPAGERHVTGRFAIEPEP